MNYFRAVFLMAAGSIVSYLGNAEGAAKAPSIPTGTTSVAVSTAAPPAGVQEGSVIAPIPGEVGAINPSAGTGAGTAAGSGLAAESSSATKNDEPSLEQQLEALSIPANEAPPGVSEERLYSVQSRYVRLRHRHEFSIGGGRNFNSDSFVVSNNIDLGYRFYLADRWFLSTSGSYVSNNWSKGAERLIATGQAKDSTFADIAFARYRVDLLAGYHLFYGKFRLSMDQVFYFDQYVALGPGYVDMVEGNRLGAVGEVGIVFWFGRNFSTRVSFKDYFVNEISRKGQKWGHNIIGGLQVGYVFGG